MKDSTLYPCPICGLPLAAYRCREHGQMHVVGEYVEPRFEYMNPEPVENVRRLVLLPTAAPDPTEPWHDAFIDFDPRPFLAAVVAYAVVRSNGRLIEDGAGSFDRHVRMALDRVVSETLIRNKDRVSFGLILQRVYKSIDSTLPERGRVYNYVVLDMIRANIDDALRWGVS